MALNTSLFFAVTAKNTLAVLYLPWSQYSSSGASLQQEKSHAFPTPCRKTHPDWKRLAAVVSFLSDPRTIPVCSPCSVLVGQSLDATAATGPWGASLCELVTGVTESQNHRMVGVGRDLCGSSSPTLLPKQGHLLQAAQNLVQAGLEYLQRRRLEQSSAEVPWTLFLWFFTFMWFSSSDVASMYEAPTPVWKLETSLVLLPQKRVQSVSSRPFPEVQTLTDIEFLLSSDNLWVFGVCRGLIWKMGVQPPRWLKACSQLWRWCRHVLPALVLHRSFPVTFPQVEEIADSQLPQQITDQTEQGASK